MLRSLLALALLGCTAAEPTTDPAERLAACTDLDCRLHALPALATVDRAAAHAHLRQQADPLHQVALVTALGGLDPSLLDGVCDDLHQSARQRCRRFVLRPHLSQPQGIEARLDPRPGGGPRGRLLPLSRTLAASADAEAGQAAAQRCGDEPDCLSEVARSEASQGHTAAAEAACRVAVDRPDCRFIAAEAALTAAGSAGMRTAVPLCAASPYAADCLSHAVSLAAPPACPADAVAPEAIAGLEAAIAALRDSLGPGIAGPIAVDYLLALWVEASVQAAVTASGDLADHLPREALPHLRFSLARRIVADEPGLDPELDTLVAALEAALAHRAGLADQGRRVPVVSIPVDRYPWAMDYVGEDTIPASFALGATRRPLGADPREDATLAVLEALAHQKGALAGSWWLTLLEDGSRSERLRWTAARLLGTLDSATLIAWVEAGGSDQSPSDQSPLVQLRLDPPLQETRPTKVAPPQRAKPRPRSDRRRSPPDASR